MARGKNCAESIMRELDRRYGLLSLEEAAMLIRLHPDWLRRRFRARTGMSFRAARVKARMRRGLYLVTTTTHTIAEISIMLGYSDRTKFEKAFRKEHGLTPTQYRRAPAR